MTERCTYYLNSRSVIFGVLTFGLGFAGMQEGLSSSLLTRWCGFGRCGSALVSIVIAVSLLGWFGVQNAVFAQGLNYALGNRLGFSCSAALSGMILTLLVAFGFTALRITAKVSVPLFITVITYISTLILTGQQTLPSLHATPMGTPISVASGITMIIGGCIVASLITPDMSRYLKNGRQVFWMTMASIIIGEGVINGLAIVVARSLHSSDIVTLMTQSAGGLGLFAVIFSTLRINDINLYSSSLSIANVVEVATGKKIRYIVITMLTGFIGTMLSVGGILHKFRTSKKNGRKMKREKCAWLSDVTSSMYERTV